MKVSFQLTMPNVASWNGKWSGEGKKYYIIKTFYKKDVEVIKNLLKGKDNLLNGTTESWYYRWEDGWGANVTLEIVDAKEAAKRQKISSGFCSYEWMIDSILKYGEIYAAHEIPKTETANNV